MSLRAIPRRLPRALGAVFLALALAGGLSAGLSGAARAQGAAQWLGPAVNGHLVMSVGNGQLLDAGGPTVSNGQPQNSALAGTRPSGLGIVNAGLGNCQFSGYASAAYAQLCWGFDGSGNGLISLSQIGGATIPAMYLSVNGALYALPGAGGGGGGNVVGPNSSRAGYLSVFNNTTGSTLADLSSASPLYGAQLHQGGTVSQSEILTLTNTNLAPTGVIPTLRIVSAGLGDNSTFIGVSNAYLVAGDAASVTGANKGVLYGLQISVQPRVARSNVPFDDATGIVLQNDSPNGSKATDAFYLGVGSNFTAAAHQFLTGVLIAPSVDSAFAISAANQLGTVQVNYGLDGCWSATGTCATFNNAVVRGPNQTPLLVGRNAAGNADVEAIRINASDGVTIRNGPTIDSTGLIIATNGVIPNVDNAVSAGSAAKRWQNVYAASFLTGTGLIADNSANLYAGTISAVALATNATGPFVYLTASAGQPVGTPAAAGPGRIACEYDTTNHRLWCYDQPVGSWKFAQMN